MSRRRAMTRSSLARFETESLVAPDAAKCATKRSRSTAAGPSRWLAKTREYRYKFSNMIRFPYEMKGPDSTWLAKFMWRSATGLLRAMPLSGFARRYVRLNQRNQFCPRHDQIHLIKEVSLACSLGDQLELSGGKALLFHRQLTSVRFRRLTYADLP